MQVLHLLDQALSFSLPTWPSYCSLLSCENSLNFSLVLSSSAEILPSGLTLHIHRAILASILSSLVASIFLSNGPSPTSIQHNSTNISTFLFKGPSPTYIKHNSTNISSFLTGQILLLYNITLRTHAEHKVPFVPTTSDLSDSSNVTTT